MARYAPDRNKRFAVFARFRVRAAMLAVYNPDRDQDDKTLRAGLRIIEVLAEEASKMG